MDWKLCVNYGSVGANATGVDGGTFKLTDAKLNSLLLLYEEKIRQDYQNC